MGDEDAVAAALDELWRKRIIREQAANAYDFTHDKLRDVAYAQTSAPQRRRLHRRVAEALAAVHEEDLGRAGARIAAHYESAGLPEQAIPHYVRAAAVAQAVYAHDETVALVGRGLSLLRDLPETGRRDAFELDFLLVLAPSYRVTRGWAALSSSRCWIGPWPCATAWARRPSARRCSTECSPPTSWPGASRRRPS
jgi:predicted ATPase